MSFTKTDPAAHVSGRLGKVTYEVSFEHVKVEISIKCPSGDIKKAVEYISLDEGSLANWEVGPGWK